MKLNVVNFRDVLCLYSKLLDGILLGGGAPLLLSEFSWKSVDVLLSLITVGSSQDNLNAYEIAEVKQLASQLHIDLKSMEVLVVENNDDLDTTEINVSINHHISEDNSNGKEAERDTRLSEKKMRSEEHIDPDQTEIEAYEDAGVSKPVIDDERSVDKVDIPGIHKHLKIVPVDKTASIKQPNNPKKRRTTNISRSKRRTSDTNNSFENISSMTLPTLLNIHSVKTRTEEKLADNEVEESPVYPDRGVPQEELLHEVVTYSPDVPTTIKEREADKKKENLNKEKKPRGRTPTVRRTLFNCPLCVVVVETRLAVRDHMAAHHYPVQLLSCFSTDEKTCTLCKVSYSDRRELAKHIGSQHKKLKEVTKMESKVYIVNPERDRVHGRTEPCNRCSTCLAGNCGDCVACKEMELNVAVLNTLCFRRRCSAQENDKNLDNHSDRDSLEKLLQSHDEKLICEKKKAKKRKFENFTKTESYKRKKVPLVPEIEESAAKEFNETYGHKIVNSEDPPAPEYQCFKCHLVVATRSDLYEHYSIKHFYTKIINKFKPMDVCPKCNFDISSKGIWVCHLGTKHNIVDIFLPQQYRIPFHNTTQPSKK